jgi:hypothetical protein
MVEYFIKAEEIDTLGDFLSRYTLPARVTLDNGTACMCCVCVYECMDVWVLKSVCIHTYISMKKCVCVCVPDLELNPDPCFSHQTFIPDRGGLASPCAPVPVRVARLLHYLFPLCALLSVVSPFGGLCLSFSHNK